MRTHFCGLVDEAMTGQTVTLCGWTDVARNLGGELLERFAIPRGPYNAQDYEHIRKLGRKYKTTDTTEAKRLVI